METMVPYYRKIFALMLIFMMYTFRYFISTFNGIIRCFKNLYSLHIFFMLKKIKSLKPIPGITNSDITSRISKDYIVVKIFKNSNSFAITFE